MSHRRKKTKIVATLGPAISSKEMLLKMVAAGVNVFRINFSHADYEDVKNRIKDIRDINEEHGYNASILADLQGPKLRVGVMKDDVVVNPGDEIIFATGERFEGTKERVYMTYERFPLDTNPGERILLDDGKLLFEVISSNQKDEVKAKVIQGGPLKSKKGVNLPNTDISQPALTEKDKADIKTAAALNTDYLAISFVRSYEDIEETRALLAVENSGAHIIAKVERAEAITEEFLPGIIESADGVMVARGDLGVEIGDANLVAVQKQLIEAANNANKVVITATQMMESMITAPTPTRAEVFDVANAVLDGTDAVMLSAETAAGEYPVETVKAMARVIEGAERHPLVQRSKHRIDQSFARIDESLALAAMYVANHLEGVKAVICMTETGFAPLIMSRITSSLPIYAMAEKQGTCEITALYKGVIPVPFPASTMDPKQVNHLAVETLREHKVVVDGDLVLITKGDFVNVQGGTNTLKVVRVGDAIQ